MRTRPFHDNVSRSDSALGSRRYCVTPELSRCSIVAALLNGSTVAGPKHTMSANGLELEGLAGVQPHIAGVDLQFAGLWLRRH